jgi:hypothetical protein
MTRPQSSTATYCRIRTLPVSGSTSTWQMCRRRPFGRAFGSNGIAENHLTQERVAGRRSSAALNTLTDHELLDSVIETVGYVDVATGIDGDALRTIELAGENPLLPSPRF